MRRINTRVIVVVNAEESKRVNLLSSRNFVISDSGIIEISENDNNIISGGVKGLVMYDHDLFFKTKEDSINIQFDDSNTVSCYHDSKKDFINLYKSSVIIFHVKDDGRFSNPHVDCFYSFEEAMDWANQYMEDVVRKPA